MSQKEEKKFPKVINLSTLTDRQKIFLEEIPEHMHETLLLVWKDYKTRKTWNNIIEQSKAEQSFYLGVETCLAMQNHSAIST